LTDSLGIQFRNKDQHGFAAIPSLACQIAGLAYHTGHLGILVLLFRVPVRRALLSLTRLKYKDLELALFLDIDKIAHHHTNIQTTVCMNIQVTTRPEKPKA
jgi:hypothetical protein